MTNTQRTTLALSAVLAGLCPLAGNGLYEGPTGTGDEVVRELGERLPASAYAGLGLELLGFVALTVLLGVLVTMTALRAPIAAAVTGIAGAAALAVKLGSITPVMALRLGPERVEAGVVDVLLDLNEAAFVVTGLLLSLALAAAGIGLLQTRSVATWLAWWPAAVGPLGVVAAGAGILAPDRYVPIPFLMLLLWMIVLGVATVVTGTQAAKSADERHAVTP